MNTFIIYGIIFVLLVVCELVYFRVAERFNIIDRPNERSSHSSIVLRGGGVIFVFGVWVWSAFASAGWLGDGSGEHYWLFLAAVTMAAGVSFVDDVHSLPDSVRLVVQFVAMGLMLAQLYFDARAEGLFADANVLVMGVMAVCALVACVGATNIYNFMDGINGITAGYSLTVLLPLMLVCFSFGSATPEFVDGSLMVVVCLSLIVFCFFNFRPKGRAKCFAGDVGSVGMAFILLFLIGRLIVRTSDVTWLILLLVYGVDGFLTICHRLMLHEHIGEAHRKHAYQLMANELKLSHPVVSLIYMALQLAVSLGFIYLCPKTVVAHWIYLLAALAVLAAAYILFMKKYYHLHEEYMERFMKTDSFKDIMNNERKMIYLCLAHMSEAGWEQKYIQEAFDTNWVVPMGPNVNAFETALADYVNSVKDFSEPLDRKVVCLSAGTAAVHLALIACGVGPGDEVCVQSFTFCASSHPVTYLGAKPVFIGSEKDTWNMDPELLEAAIIDRYRKTGRYPKAIVPVTLYGMPYQVDRIMAIADKYGIPVVEDTAEGLGSRFGGQRMGTFGLFGVLSFNGNKMITTSGGGALICRRAEDAQDAMWYATQARDAYPYYQHTSVGYNYRMSNVCAGIGRGQMTVLDEHIAHHRLVQGLYEELFSEVPGLHVHSQPADSRYESNFWLCAVTLDPSVRVKGQENAYRDVIKTAVGGAAGVIHAVDCPTTDCQPNENVEALRVWMLDHKVECRPVWKPMHKQPVYSEGAAEIAPGIIEGPKMSVYTRGVEEDIFKVGFCLPAGPYVTDDDVRYIVRCVKDAIAG